GYHFYTQLEVGDNIIIYNKYQNQSVIGIGEVSKHIHEKPPIPGRTNSTAIEIFYEKDIKPISLGHLNKHPKLKNLYFLQENAKQSIASMSQAQYDAILDMSMNNGIKHPFETVKKAELSTQNAEDDSLKPFVLLV
ncbi:EVE domain-containing protein, partial [Paenibacillus macerans]